MKAQFLQIWSTLFEHLQKEPELLGTGQCGTVKGQLLEGLGRLEHRQQERSVQRFPGESDLQHLQAAFWDFCFAAAQTRLWPAALQLVFEVEADGERVELGQGAQDAADELHAGHVGEHVTDAEHAEAALWVAGQGPEPGEDAGDVGIQAIVGQNQVF